MSTGPLSYGYTWQFPDYTASNTSYNTSGDGISGPKDMYRPSLLPTPTMSHLSLPEKTCEPFQVGKSSWLEDSYVQDTLGMDLLALKRQKSPQSVSRTSVRHRCYDHGCDGRSFSSRSNLRRHQRERARMTKILSCPLCGAQFYRRWTRNQHVLRASCTLRTPKSRSYPDVDQDSQYEQSQRSHGHTSTSLVPNWCSEPPSPVTSAPIFQLSRRQSALRANFDASSEALACYWPALIGSDSPETFDWTVRSYPGTPAHCP